MALNQTLFDSTVELHLDIERVSVTLRADVVQMLSDLERELRMMLIGNLDAMSRARINKQLREIEAVTRQYYTGINDMTASAGTDIATASASATAEALGVAVGGQVTIALLPDAAYMETLANGTIVQGAPQAAWWSKQSADMVFKFQNAVRMGLVGAETNAQIIARVQSAIEVGQRDAEALVRTSAQSVANEARAMVFRDNRDMIKGLEWCATLDRRTCLVCGALDGKRWSLDSVPNKPPKHFNCRCSTVPVLKTWVELGINVAELPPGTRASMDGQVSDTTFAEWLRRKSETDPAFADKALGRGRAKLWLENKITLDALLTNSVPMSLKDLRKKYT